MTNKPNPRALADALDAWEGVLPEGINAQVNIVKALMSQSSQELRELSELLSEQKQYASDLRASMKRLQAENARLREFILEEIPEMFHHIVDEQGDVILKGEGDV